MFGIGHRKHPGSTPPATDGFDSRDGLRQRRQDTSGTPHGSLSSSFKRKFFSGLVKLKGLTGGKPSSKRSSKAGHLPEVVEDRPCDLANGSPLGLPQGPGATHVRATQLGPGPSQGSLPITASSDESEEPGAAALLRRCAAASADGGCSRATGAVPVVTAEGLRRALGASRQAVMVGPDPPGSEPLPLPSGIQHCSAELPSALQRKITAGLGSAGGALAALAGSGGQRQPSFSRVLRAARRNSGEGMPIRTVGGGGSMPTASPLGPGGAVASSLPNRVPAAPATAMSVSASGDASASASAATAAASAASAACSLGTQPRPFVGMGSPTPEVLTRGFTSSAAFKEWPVKTEAGADISGRSALTAADGALANGRASGGDGRLTVKSVIAAAAGGACTPPSASPMHCRGGAAAAAAAGTAGVSSPAMTPPRGSLRTSAPSAGGGGWLAAASASAASAPASAAAAAAGGKLQAALREDEDLDWELESTDDGELEHDSASESVHRTASSTSAAAPAAATAAAAAAAAARIALRRSGAGYMLSDGYAGDVMAGPASSGGAATAAAGASGSGLMPPSPFAESLPPLGSIAEAARASTAAASAAAGGADVSTCAAEGEAADPSSGLEPMFVTPAVHDVLGSSEVDAVRQALYSLFCSNPSLILILEDLVSSALYGRSVVHEQLLAYPRGGAASTAPRNPLDDFLLLQVTACYVDNVGPGATSSDGSARLSGPGFGSGAAAMPALFLTLSRPYSTALAAGAAAAARTAAAASVAPPPAPPLTPVPSAAASAPPSASKLHKSPSLTSALSSITRAGRSRQARLSSTSGGNAPCGTSPPPPSYLSATTSTHPGLPEPSGPVSAASIATSSIATTFAGAAGSGGASMGGSGGGGCYGLATAPPATAGAGAAAAQAWSGEEAAAVAAALEGLCARVRLEQTLLAHVPVAITVLTLDGRVTWQNGRSVSYMGNAVGAPVAPGMDPGDPDHALCRIFSYDSTALESMWEALQASNSRTWSGLVCMPPSLDLAQPPDASPFGKAASGADDVGAWTVRSLLNATGAGAGSGGRGGGGGGGGGGDGNQGPMGPEDGADGASQYSLWCRTISGLGGGGGGGGRSTSPMSGYPSLAAAATAAAATTATAGSAPALQTLLGRDSSGSVAWPGGALTGAALAEAAAGQPPLSRRASGNVAYMLTPSGAGLSPELPGFRSGNAGANSGGLPRNTSAPSFRAAGMGVCPLPSVMESEACTDVSTGGSVAATVVASSQAAATAAAVAAAQSATAAVDLPRRVSASNAPPGPLPTAGPLFSSSPSHHPLATTCGSAAAGSAAAAVGLFGSSAAGSAGPLSPVFTPHSQGLPFGSGTSMSRRSRIHRSNSLAATEGALGGSYRAMRLAQGWSQALAQGMQGVLGGGGRSGSVCSGDGVALCCSPRGSANHYFGSVLTAAGGGNTAAAAAGAAEGLSLQGAAAAAAAVAACGRGVGGGGALSLASPATSTGGGGGGSRVLSPSGGTFGRLAAAAAATGGPDSSRSGGGGGLSRTCSNANAAAEAAAATAIAGVPYNGNCLWHEIHASLVLDSVSACWQIVLVNHDVTPYVQAELEMRQVLDAEHRILEECFPRHVLEAMTSVKRRASVFGPAAAAAAAAATAAAATGPGAAAAPYTASPLHLSRPSLSCSQLSTLQPSAFMPSALRSPYRAHGMNGTGSGSGNEPLPTAPTLPSVVTHRADAHGPHAMGAQFDRSSAPIPAGQYNSPRAPAAVMAGPAAGAGPRSAAGPHTASGVVVSAAAAAAAAAAGGDNAASTMNGSERSSAVSACLYGTANVSCTTMASHPSTALMYGNDGSYTSYMPYNDDRSGSHQHAPSESGCVVLGFPEDQTSPVRCAAVHGARPGPGPGPASRQKLSDQSELAPEAAPPAEERAGDGGGDGEGNASGGASAAGAAAGGSAAAGSHGGMTALGSPLAADDGCSLGLSGGMALPLETCLTSYMARSHESVTVLFADIASFTNMCGQVPPHSVMAFLNDLFTVFDQLVEAHGLYKVETIGDCYMVAGGLMEQDAEGFRSVAEGVDPEHAAKVFAFAVDMLEAARNVPMPGSGAPVKLRVGLHSGPVMSGVVGTMMPRFCLFGDTVNTASRMESTGSPGAIHVSSATRELLGTDVAGFAPTGGVSVKGKGLMYTYLYDPSTHGAATGAVAERPVP
ncbi:hypothetical protein HYH03_011816 [Edaphochlamys debaryana]|uniref:Guanylate cyclase domain-containing protein n=1 Tax=Edaphochlamys debaryana TaxID=47281 RepID=A0A835Y250_9CHLO|nr:hypothetical protein HYH03_011816 [Edaphochlamys debaryana]|eukprot:KAG2489709.1 hypothetical protein HYH03_011816 [Edaphochlamys debaryana]